MLYRHLTQEAHRETPFYAKGWYLRGLNDFEEGQSLLKMQAENPALQIQEEANKAFERAISSLKHAFELLLTKEKERAGLALKYQAQAAFQQKTADSAVRALETLDLLLYRYPDILDALSDPGEIYYLHGLIAISLAKGDQERKYIALAEDSLQQGIAKFPKGEFSDASLYLLATLYYQQNQYSKAEEHFVKLATDYPLSASAGNALFWAARCAENQQDAKNANAIAARFSNAILTHH